MEADTKPQRRRGIYGATLLAVVAAAVGWLALIVTHQHLDQILQYLPDHLAQRLHLELILLSESIAIAELVPVELILIELILIELILSELRLRSAATAIVDKALPGDGAVGRRLR